jgi:hypothetical protein
MSRAPLELRERDRAEAWLAAGLCLTRMAPPSPNLGSKVAPWVDRVLSDLGALPPVGVLADIGYLITGASMRALAPLPPLHAEFAQLIHSYEDHVLGRLDADPRLEAVVDALARLPEKQRDRGVALFTGQLCRRLGFSAAVALSPGVSRRTMERPTDEVVRLGHAVLATRGDIERALMAGYRDLIANARRRGSLISEAEVFLMEHLDALGDLTQRIAIAQIIEVTDALTQAMPRRLKPNAQAELARVPTELTATDNYPTGGFSALSTSGSIENLVSSELIYMEDAVEGRDLPDRLPDIDLFDVRFAEGELLYYTRDESVFVRGHRVVSFVLMPGLVSARFKDSELSWQRLIMLLGLINCCVRRLVEWLAHEGLSFHILFVRDPRAGESQPLHIERGLCELSLQEFIGKELVHVAEALSVEAALAQAGNWAASSRSDVLLMDAGPVSLGSLAPPPGVLLGTLTLDQVEPHLRWGSDTAQPGAPKRRSGSEPSEIDPWPAWVQCALELLQALL